MAFLTTLLVGFVASSALIVGGVVGAYWSPSQKLVAGALALLSGALFTALAFDLFKLGGPWLASGGLLVGAGLFTGFEWWLENSSDENKTGLALIANVTLDGVPENVALGIVLISTDLQGALAILTAIFLSNLPEAIGGAKDMKDGGRSKREVVGIWAATALLLTAAVVAGNTTFAGLSAESIAIARAFAGGVVLAGITDEILPDAYEEGGPLIAMATAVGFLVTFLLR